MKNIPDNGGFSLIEALISLSLGTAFLASVLSAWVLSSQVLKEETVKGKVRYDVQKSMELIKDDIRLTDGNGILFYPSSASTYTAFSFPKAIVTSGFFTISTTISWDQTIAYHVYDNNGTHELRRTVFSSYSSSTSTRQAQLDSLAVNGTYVNTSTRTLVKAPSVSLQINPTNQTYDGYSASLARTSGSFGSLRLSSGSHRIKFRVTGKNASSSGYRMGIDQITLTPSGGSGQEAEVLTVNADSGDTKNTEDMSSYSATGSWGGNYQMEYQSNAANDYIEFLTNYDQWLESNFGNMTFTDTEVTGTDPVISVASRENQCLVLGWTANAQTTAVMENNGTNVRNKTIRSIISSGNITKSGQMIRFKFSASSTGDLRINSAYFGPRTSGTANYSSTPTQLYFGNAAAQQGSTAGVGAVGSTGPTSILVPANSYVWSNWMIYSVATGGSTDYLVSFAVPDTASEGNESYWIAGSGTYSYKETGNTPTATWASSDDGYDATSSSVQAVGEMGVWTNTGTATSQIYDTTLTTPIYGQLSWDTNAAGTYGIKVRASANSDMSGATAWSALTAYTVNPSTLTAVASQRYLQFQATLTMASPYTSYPNLDDVKITWPGATALVEISGYYTKRPNYGTFDVLVDDTVTVQALSVDLTATDTYKTVNRDFTLRAEVKPKNTGK